MPEGIQWNIRASCLALHRSKISVFNRRRKMALVFKLVDFLLNVSLSDLQTILFKDNIDLT